LDLSAGVYRRVADELEQRHEAWLAERVTIPEGMALSGYSEAQLHKFRCDGVIDLTRASLPRKPNHLKREQPQSDPFTVIAEKIAQSVPLTVVDIKLARMAGIDVPKRKTVRRNARRGRKRQNSADKPT